MFVSSVCVFTVLLSLRPYRYLDNKVFVSLANGEVIVYQREAGMYGTFSAAFYSDKQSSLHPYVESASALKCLDITVFVL